MNTSEISFLPVNPAHRPPLDTGFLPAFLWRRAYRDLVAKDTRSVPVSIALAQPDGVVSVFRTLMLPEGVGYDAVNFHYLERTLKFLLWSRGGSKVFIAGAPATARRIAAVYAPGQSRAFDAEFFGDKIYLDGFAVTACEESDLPAEREVAHHGKAGLEGCRIGFDLGGSDRKVAAVMDGKVVFSEETPWDPYFQSDPAYHEKGIRESLQRAAKHLPRVDAIGGSAAGVYIDNEPRVASLFRGVPAELFASRVRPIFKRIVKEWKVPVVVANDGDVSALAATHMLGEVGAAGGVLGLALGTSLAAGYVAPGGQLKGWLNELAFVPVDYRTAAEGAHVDEWSGDVGTGARYHSQQMLGQLLVSAAHGIPEELGLPEKLVRVQEAMERGESWARLIYESGGVYLGYSLAHFSEFYDFKNLLVLGRVASGSGGDLMLEKACEVLRDEAPDLAGKIVFAAADEKFKRHGQAIAAAGLPEL